MSTSYTERLKRLEERAEQIKEQTKELKKITTKQNRKLIDKRKTVVGALLISQSKKEVYARKALIKLFECADEKDKELLKVLLNFETESPKEPEALRRMTTNNRQENLIRYQKVKSPLFIAKNAIALPTAKPIRRGIYS